MEIQSNNQETTGLMEDNVFRFFKGILGFPLLNKYRIDQHDEHFSLLQSVEDENVAFILVNPFQFITDYEFEISDDLTEELEIKDESEVAVRCIVTWHSNEELVTVNLVAPIIFNVETKAGKQIVLQNTLYTTKVKLWRNKPELAESEGF